MQNFPHLESQNNVPGYDTFYFANAATIGALTIKSSVVSTAPSMGGAVFYEGYSTKNKLDLKIQPKETDEGFHYEVTLSGSMPKHKSEILDLFEEMINLYHNVIVRDNNGKYVYIGGAAQLGMSFTYQPTDSGYDFEFSCVQKFAPPFYTASIPT